jgi:hypothetical protein
MFAVLTCNSCTVFFLEFIAKSSFGLPPSTKLKVLTAQSLMSVPFRHLVVVIVSLGNVSQCAPTHSVTPQASKLSGIHQA